MISATQSGLDHIDVQSQTSDIQEACDDDILLQMVNPTGHGNLTAQMDTCQYSIWKNNDMEMSCYGIKDQKETR
jgi:hypothetical protein